jgi:hypothetical protein
MTRKLAVVAALAGVAALAAVSLASAGSGTAVRPQLPGEAKTLDAHQVTGAQGKALGATVAAKSSKFALRYLFADLNVSSGETDGGAIKCPKNWHPVSGLWIPGSEGVVNAASAPVSERKWAVFVLNEGPQRVKVTVGAVCEKGLPLTAPGG